MPQFLSVRSRWCEFAAVTDNDSASDDAAHNFGEQALSYELLRPPEALGGGSVGLVADDAGSGGSWTQLKAEEVPSSAEEPKPSDAACFKPIIC